MHRPDARSDGVAHAGHRHVAIGCELAPVRQEPGGFVHHDEVGIAVNDSERRDRHRMGRLCPKARLGLANDAARRLASASKMDWSRQQSERRRDPRFEILAQVRVKSTETDYVLEVKNLSASGALIELGSLERPGWLKIGRRVELTLFVPDHEASADIAGDVVRIVEDSRMCAFGVQFVNTSSAAKSYLEQLLGPGRTLRPKPPPLPAT
jgi:hypothetical protein